MFALVDCNNFYASCERAFNPSLIGRPVIVLSNNDGCVIARSNEAKKLGIKMGIPEYQVKDIVKAHNIAVFSSNYVLYGDMSNRVMFMLQRFAPEIEIYSIDEAFLNLSGMQYFNLKDFGSEVTKAVAKGTGIPVSMGIAPTKTLAKIANKFAKKYPKYDSVCVIDTDQKRETALKLTDVGDVWGIGHRNVKKLAKEGVKTAFDFTILPRGWVRKNMTVVGERTWLELRGESCIDLELIQPDKKQICTSRSFGKMIEDFNTLSEAVATHACACARKLRDQESCAVSLMVFIHTNNFRPDLPQYFRNSIIDLPVPTNSSIEITKYALIALKNIYKAGFQYKKAGVIITEITKNVGVQKNLFYDIDDEKHKKLMAALDKITDTYGKNLLKLGVQGTGELWKLRQEKLSPCYSTRLNDIINIKL